VSLVANKSRGRGRGGGRSRVGRDRGGRGWCDRWVEWYNNLATLIILIFALQGIFYTLCYFT